MNEFDILYMNCHIPFPKRVALEVNRAAFRTEMLTHPINRLFWECTLRCNLNCRHCGSDCLKTAGLAFLTLSFRTCFPFWTVPLKTLTATG